MGIAHEVSVVAGHALQGVRAGAEKLAASKVANGIPPTIEVTSIAFEPNTPLPISCTEDGVGAAPPLSFRGAPDSARSLVLLCEDPDAPLFEPYVHWLVYGVPPATEAMDAHTQSAYRLGENGRGDPGFAPAAPPAGHGVHRYHFQVFALDVPVDLGAGADRGKVLELMKDHVVAWGELVGTYQRE
jgi:Raf kinase inhibitor-like YbhB/YbcL family protein